MDQEMDQESFLEEENIIGQEIKSIEINLNVIKQFFINTISLYEYLIKRLCSSCNVIESEEFINLHKNLIEFENIFKIFDVAFNKSLLTNFCKKNSSRKEEDSNEVREDEDESPKHRCLINSCNQVYFTEEGVKIHFIKSHCKKGDVFDMISDHADPEQVDFNKVERDKKGRYICGVVSCRYASADRSNFKVHMKRHYNNRKFVCICKKKFFSRDPLMIHFLRLHMKEVDWSLAQTDIKTLRKTIRRLINRQYYMLGSNDHIPDSDSDLNGPMDEEITQLNELISHAIVNPTQGGNALVCEGPDETVENKDTESPHNSFSVSLNLKDNFFTDSVTFKSEGVEKELEDLIKNPLTETSTRTMSLSETKNKLIKKEIPQRHRKYKCPHKFCSQDFFTTKNLLTHLKASHDPNNPIPCNEPGCSARFKSTALLAQHQKRHQVQYSCSICSYKTHLAALMTRHNRQHAGEHLHHECNICHEKFEYLGSFRTHMQKVHNEEEPLKCEWPDCNKRFKTIVGLKKHAREFHMNMRPEIPCEWPDCNAVFSNKSAMSNHMRIHTNERPYQCSWQDCGKWFRLKETLKRHIKLHQGFRPHVCPFDNCDWTFITKRNLKSHIEKGHLNNGKNTRSKSKLQEIEVDPDMTESDKIDAEMTAGYEMVEDEEDEVKYHPELTAE